MNDSRGGKEGEEKQQQQQHNVFHTSIVCSILHQHRYMNSRLLRTYSFISNKRAWPIKKIARTHFYLSTVNIYCVLEPTQPCCFLPLSIE
jgi:hypothetical protein